MFSKSRANCCKGGHLFSKNAPCHARTHFTKHGSSAHHPVSFVHAGGGDNNAPRKNTLEKRS